MRGFREAVDDGDRRRTGETLERFVGVRANHDRVDVARKNPGRVFGRLARAHHKVAALRDEGVAAELGHRDLERGARAQRGLLKEHSKRLAAQHRQLIGNPARLEMHGKSEDRADFQRREIPNPKKIAPPEGDIRDRSQHDLYNYADYA
jgi:hypothetical protein